MQSTTPLTSPAPPAAGPAPNNPTIPAAPQRVPLVDLRAEYQAIKAEIDAAIAAVIAEAAFIRGPFATRLEADWARFCGASHAVGCASGTAALELALLAVGIGPGDEVVTTPLTFIATVEAIVHTGATPVFADVDPATCNLSIEAAAAAITPRTRALLPVDLYGQPADMAAFQELAAARGLRLIEDAAQAHGAAWAGRRTGSDGTADVTTFSFYPGKNLGAYGDAGALVTADRAVADRARRLADHGRAEKYAHDVVGFNSRLDGMQAAVLGAKLPHLDGWNAARRRLAARYDSLLAPLVAAGQISLVRQAPDAESVYHLYVIRVPEPPASPGRERVREALRARGIEAQVHYPIALHLQPALAPLGYGAGAFPCAERAAAEVLSLPLFPLMTDTQQDDVVAGLHEALTP